MAPPSTDIDVALDELEARLERLRSLYEQYFIGIEKIEPSVPRQDVDRRIYALRKVQIRNTAKRFKLQTIIQRYNAFQQYWLRTCREIENGTYHRHVARAQSRFGDVPLTVAGRRKARRKAEAEEQRAMAEQKDRVMRAAEDDLEALLSEDPETALSEALEVTDEMTMPAADRFALAGAGSFEIDWDVEDTLVENAPPAAVLAVDAARSAHELAKSAGGGASGRTARPPKPPPRARQDSIVEEPTRRTAGLPPLDAALSSAPARQDATASKVEPAAAGAKTEAPPVGAPKPRRRSERPKAAAGTKPDVDVVSEAASTTKSLEANGAAPAAAAKLPAAATPQAKDAAAKPRTKPPEAKVPAGKGAETKDKDTLLNPAAVRGAKPQPTRADSWAALRVPGPGPAPKAPAPSSVPAEASKAAAPKTTAAKPAGAEASKAAAPKAAAKPAEANAGGDASKAAAPKAAEPKAAVPPVAVDPARAAVAKLAASAEASSSKPAQRKPASSAPAAPAAAGARPKQAAAEPASPPAQRTAAQVRPAEPQARPGPAPVARAAASAGVRPAAAEPMRPAAAAAPGARPLPAAEQSPVAAAKPAPAERELRAEAAPDDSSRAAEARAAAANARAAAARAAEVRAAAAAPRSRLDDERVGQLYGTLVAERRRLQQPGKVSVDALASSLRETESKLRQQYAGKDIDFHVVVKNGKAMVKPIIG